VASDGYIYKSGQCHPGLISRSELAPECPNVRN